MSTGGSNGHRAKSYYSGRCDRIRADTRSRGKLAALVFVSCHIIETSKAADRREVLAQPRRLVPAFHKTVAADSGTQEWAAVIVSWKTPRYTNTVIS
jgi:hypothetical protein